MANFTTEEHIIPAVDIVFGTVSLLAILVGVGGNSVALLYFSQRKKKLSNILYLIIALTDIVTCLVSLPSSITLTTARTFILSKRSAVICNVCGLLFNLTQRYSVFLVAMLSTLRAIALQSPFRRISRGVVCGVLVTYAIFLLAQQSLPYAYRVTYFYLDHWTHCSWDIAAIADSNTVEYKAMFFIFLPLEMTLPAIPIVLSCILTVILLVRDVKQGHGIGSDKKMKASWTIVIVTGVYIVLNVPYWIFIIIFYTAGEPLTWLATEGQYILLFLSRTSVVLNAGINPLIYFTRMTEMTQVLVGKRRPSRSTTVVNPDVLNCLTPDIVRRKCAADPNMPKYGNMAKCAADLQRSLGRDSVDNGASPTVSIHVVDTPHSNMPKYGNMAENDRSNGLAQNTRISFVDNFNSSDDIIANDEIVLDDDKVVKTCPNKVSKMRNILLDNDVADSEV